MDLRDAVMDDMRDVGRERASSMAMMVLCIDKREV